MSEEKKQRLKEYQNSYREAKKSQYNNKSNNFFNCNCNYDFNSYTNKIFF